MLIKKTIFFVLLIFLVNYFYGQQNNTWFFGRQGGLNFNPIIGNPVPYPDFNSGMTANEGCSSVSDLNGNILFYSNGTTVYNKLHQVMLNGSGLLGHISAFQSSIIVPLPNNDSIFYIFTTDAFENKYANGYRYSVVNIKNDNGKGEVITKNILLSSPSSERLTAARHANGIDVWIITNANSSNVFNAWLLTCNGLQAAPVISTLGALMNQHSEMNIGSMKVSPDGSKLCQTHFPDIDNSFPENFFQLFDFDNSTGKLSNVKKIIVPDQRYYASEFSPDSKLLYVSKAQDSTIDQFNASLNSAAAIIASKFSIHAENGIYGMQLGPDKKIYTTKSNSLISVISNPDIAGPGCNFELNKINIAPKNSGLNLPSFINDLSINPFINYTILDSCKASLQFFGLVTIPGPIQWNWDLGDGTTSTLQNPSHIYSSNKNLYTVKLRITSPTVCGYIERSITITAGGLMVSADFDFVNACDSGYIRFINKSVVYPDNGTNYIWDFGDGTTSNQKDPKHSFNGSGSNNVKLKVITTTKCFDDSITKKVSQQQFAIQAPPDQTINAGQSVQLYVTGSGVSYYWSPPRWLDNPTIEKPIATPLENITYSVSVTNESGCVATDSVFIKVNPIQDIYMPTGFTPNNDGRNDIIRPLIGPGYLLKKFTIYNRWGQIVFSTSKNGEGWDGTIKTMPQNSGMYVWLIKAEDKKQNAIEKKGTLILIR